MKIFYFFIKLFNPTRDQITFISRQDSGYSLDMDLEVSSVEFWAKAEEVFGTDLANVWRHFVNVPVIPE